MYFIYLYFRGIMGINETFYEDIGAVLNLPITLYGISISDGIQDEHVSTGVETMDCLIAIISL